LGGSCLLCEVCMHYRVSIKHVNGSVTEHITAGKVEHVTSDFMRLTFDTPISVKSGEELVIEYIHEGNPGSCTRYMPQK
jgi:hypothetical protein